MQKQGPGATQPTDWPLRAFHQAAATALPANLLEMQSLRPNPGPPEPEAHV